MADMTLFIDLVRARPVLYDLANPNYKDSATVKRNNWQDVVDEWRTISGEELTCMYYCDCTTCTSTAINAYHITYYYVL